MKLITLAILTTLCTAGIPVIEAQELPHILSFADSEWKLAASPRKGWVEQGATIKLVMRSYCPACNSIHPIAYRETKCRVAGCALRHYFLTCDDLSVSFVDLNANDSNSDFWEHRFMEVLPTRLGDGRYELEPLVEIMVDRRAFERKLPKYRVYDEDWISEGSSVWFVENKPPFEEHPCP